MIATVKYQVATYNGEINVECEDWETNDILIARAKSMLNRLHGPLPIGYESYKVIERY